MIGGRKHGNAVAAHKDHPTHGEMRFPSLISNGVQNHVQDVVILKHQLREDKAGEDKADDRQNVSAFVRDCR